VKSRDAIQYLGDAHTGDGCIDERTPITGDHAGRRRGGGIHLAKPNREGCTRHFRLAFITDVFREQRGGVRRESTLLRLPDVYQSRFATPAAHP
jgi:hypothetical protein